MKHTAVVAVLLCSLALSGCGLNHEVRTVPDANSALIFGYFDMSEAPYELGCVRITQDEKAGIAYRQSCMTTLKSGLFYLEDAPAMKYHIPFFYAGGRLHQISADKQDVINVPAGSMYFVGSYKYKVVHRDLGDIVTLKPEQYGLNRVKSPNETAVLKMLLDNVQDARWKQRIKGRMAQR
jgi:hypothetical protein